MWKEFSQQKQIIIATSAWTDKRMRYSINSYFFTCQTENLVSNGEMNGGYQDDGNVKSIKEP